MDYKTNEIFEIEKVLDFKISDFNYEEGKLECITLSNNKIEKTQIDKIKKHFKNLKRLYISNTEIEDLTFIDELVFLEELSITNCKLKDIPLKKQNNNLKIIDLSCNQIENIDFLKNYKKIETISLNENEISDVLVLKNFKTLNNLYLTKNKIIDISSLKNIKIKGELLLGENAIFDLTPLYDSLKKNQIQFMNAYDNPLIYPHKEIVIRGDNAIYGWFDGIIENANNEIKRAKENNSKILDLGKLGLTDLSLIPNLFELVDLEELILSNEWAEYDESNCIWKRKESKNNNYKSLKNNISFIPKDFEKLKNLKRLIIGGDWKGKNDKDYRKWRIKDCNSVFKLENLEFFNISNNDISDIKGIIKLPKISIAHLNNNNISSVPKLKDLKNLKEIYLSNNNIKDLKFLDDCVQIETIDLHSNKIKELKQFVKIINLNQINFLIANKNPFCKNIDAVLFDYENHLNSIKNELSRFLETNKIGVILPAKVLLLGNSNAGKSTFVNYFIYKTINKLESTPLLKILKYKVEEKNHNLPQAILFDFGGQDYYHGVYKAFLTNEAINLIFWKKDNDKNKIVPDREKEDSFTQNFNRNYWIHQINFHNTNKEKEQQIFLVQTHADEDKRDNFKGDFEQLNIENEFFVALVNESLKDNSHKNNLDYLENTLISKIIEKRDTKKEPQWYIDFLEFVYNYDNEQSIDLHELRKKYKRVKDNTKENFIDDLDQLSKKGLILFYKDNENLNKKAWLNPTLTVEYIHKNILTEKILNEKKGKIDKNILNADEDILALLIENKVIYLDNLENKYIVPGYLPTAKQDNEDFFIFSDFNEFNFVLKFENYIPFGFMNQLICKYGGNQEKKMYWKDQLIFTTQDRKAKVLIHLDFEHLEIKVSLKKIKEEKININEIEVEIFSTILKLILDYKIYEIDTKNDNNKNEFLFNNSPLDLFISINNKDFVNHQKLQESETTSIILSCQKNEDGTLNKQNGKSISTINFKNFTTNRNINNMKKIFISYSRKDVGFKDELKKHLSLLKTMEILDNWSCEEISIGKWDDQIQKELNECDVIVYMLSHNFFTSRYILENEVLKGMKMLEENSNKKILCVIVTDFIGIDKLKDLNKIQSDLTDSILKLGEQQYLPYDRILNSTTRVEEEKIVSLEEFARQGRLNTALKQIAEKIINDL